MPKSLAEVNSIPRNSCRFAACVAEDVGGFGVGSVSGNVVRDMICSASASEGRLELAAGSSGAACARMNLVVATELSPNPFGVFPFDGIIGLGLPPLSLTPEFGFFQAMRRAGVLRENKFSVWLAEGGDGSEIALGGMNQEQLASPVQWSPVVLPQQGHWQIEMLGFHVGNITLDICRQGGCRGVVDSGTSHIAIPSPHESDVVDLLTLDPEAVAAGDISGVRRRCRARELLGLAPGAARSGEPQTCRAAALGFPSDSTEASGAPRSPDCRHLDNYPTIIIELRDFNLTLYPEDGADKIGTSSAARGRSLGESAAGAAGPADGAPEAEGIDLPSPRPAAVRRPRATMRRSWRPAPLNQTALMVPRVPGSVADTPAGAHTTPMTSSRGTLQELSSFGEASEADGDCRSGCGTLGWAARLHDGCSWPRHLKNLSSSAALPEMLLVETPDYSEAESQILSPLDSMMQKAKRWHAFTRGVDSLYAA
ncbi:unnamed protein product [Prorocentrum cordatum]|uniref:Peptidase A1 domain-containing protein n=1 Tax=Prorocentrum cordatum TaxID=2364126 RepID=A0ABN9XGS2_9DINO|nr:unnamed protein product [Polarella glacialis]